MKLIIYSALGLFFLMQLIAAPTNANTTQQNSHFLIMTDIHFNPFATCPKNQPNCQMALKLKNSGANEWEEIFDEESNQQLSNYYQDSDYALLKNSLLEAQKLIQQNSPDFMMIPGDFLAHHFCEQYQTYTSDNTQEGCSDFARKTMSFLAIQLKAAFPNTPIYAALGNNDADTGDYSIQPHGEFLNDTAIAWSDFFKNQSNKIHFLKSFIRAGYYEITPPNSLNDRIIILNSTPFSPEATSNGDLQQIALAELTWLNQQLEFAKIFHQKVWIMLHIPVGIDVYASLQANKITSYWSEPYTQLFLELLDQYHHVIHGVFSGHAHMDMFNVVKENNGSPIAIMTTPSISPIFGNNPGIKIFTYNAKRFLPEDYIVYDLNLSAKDSSPAWQKEYDFNATYQTQDHSPKNNPNLNKELDHLANNIDFKMGKYAEDYQHYYEANSPEDSPILHHYANYWCDVENLTIADYENCMKNNVSS